MLKWFRLLHLYLGVFITPAVLFFAVSGALQTFGLHETNRDHPDYKPAAWIETLANIHKHQMADKPGQPKRDPPAPCLTYGPKPVATPPPDAPAGGGHNPLPMQIFFVVVSWGLLVSTSTGLYMSWKYRRNRLLVLGTLLAGIVVPVLLLLF